MSRDSLTFLDGEVPGADAREISFLNIICLEPHALAMRLGPMEVIIPATPASIDRWPF